MQPLSVVHSMRGIQGDLSPSSHRALLVEGMRNIGVEVLEPDMYGDVRGKHVCAWGWRRSEVFRNKGYEVLVMERGYIGDRFKLTSLGWNGLNGFADFPEYPDDGGARFREHGGVLKPWKEKGDYVLILGQVRGDASLRGQDISSWYEKTAKAIKKHYGVPVYFRMHPDAIRRGGYKEILDVPRLEGTLEQALSEALFTVAYNSNSCLDSILAGVPCYAGDRGTMAFDLCMPHWQALHYPDRERAVHRIAWTQWSQEEIRTGIALEKLVERMR